MAAVTITGTIKDSLDQAATGRLLVRLAQAAYGEAALYLPVGELAVTPPSSVSFSAMPSAHLVPAATAYSFAFIDSKGRQQLDKTGVVMLGAYNTLDDFI